MNMDIDMHRLGTRLANTRPSATYRMMDRVAARRASGAQVISLSAGEPDFDTPMHICAKPGGAFYAFASCKELIGRRTAAGTRLNDDEDVAGALLDEAGVAVVPGSAFGLGPYIRIAYALDDEALIDACRAIQHFCRSLTGECNVNAA